MCGGRPTPKSLSGARRLANPAGKPPADFASLYPKALIERGDSASLTSAVWNLGVRRTPDDQRRFRLPAPPIVRIDPALPMLRMEPALPIERMDPALPRLRMEPALPIERIENALNRLAALSRV